jgi:hypothetical protein
VRVPIREETKPAERITYLDAIFQKQIDDKN